MTITPVTTTTTPAPAATSATANGADPSGALNFTKNFDTFLTLLTTQLKNQNPLSPMDTSQFTQQLVAFSQVEQQIKTNSQLSTMIQGQSAGEAISALPMIGRTIEYTGNQAVLQNGKAAFSYTLPTAAAAASVLVKDTGGNTVFSQIVDPSAGKHSIAWNGKTSGGVQMADGSAYTIQVQAVDATNSAIAATSTAIGTVTGVSVVNNAATFDVAGVSVPMTNLLTIVGNSTTTASN
jgi:flagellar basal-body rod modification protein FlgD